MRFVPVKTAEQQAALMLHRVARSTGAPAHAADQCDARASGRVRHRCRDGRDGLKALIAIVTDEANRLTARTMARKACCTLVCAAVMRCSEQIGDIERSIHAQHRSNDASRRLETIPGIGVIGATAIAATVTDPTAFKSGREFAAWIGLVPRQNSTGGKERLGRISKQGDRYLRRLLVVGATAVIRHARAHPDKHPWLIELLARSRPRSSRWRWPTRWRASPGRCWPGAKPIERRRLRQRLKRLGDEGVELRRQARSELRG